LPLKAGLKSRRQAGIKKVLDKAKRDLDNRPLRYNSMQKRKAA
jgi:hypothetical protein